MTVVFLNLIGVATVRMQNTDQRDIPTKLDLQARNFTTETKSMG